MDKSARKRAVQAEIDRRANSLGVPPHLQVYEMLTQLGDEGGPRTFVPIKEVISLQQQEYERSFWPSLMRAAIENGTPIELMPDNSRMYRDGRTPLADICAWGFGDDELLIFGERANTLLGDLLRSCCRPIPVTCATEKLFAYHVEAIEDVLDLDHCEADWRLLGGGRKYCSRIINYAMQTEKLGHASIFRIPENSFQILVLQPIVDIVCEHGLTGYRFKRVWPHSPMPQVVSVEVKKLPAKGRKKPEPTFTTTAQQVAAGFVDETLGRLSEPGGEAFELVAYQLPDLSLPSGSIVAADLLVDKGEPFARQVKPGAYPLLLIAVTVGGRREEHITFAMIKFSDRTVAAWEVAALDSAGKPRKGSENGYVVDSGNGGFCDAGAQGALLDLADPERSLEKRIEKEMEKSYRHARSWVHIQTKSGSAAIFSSGFGDGQYQSYFGLDDNNDPVVLMTDFGVVDWSHRPAHI